MAVFGTLETRHPAEGCATFSLIGSGAPPATLTTTEDVDGLGGWKVDIAPGSSYMDESSATVYIFGTDGAWHEV